MTQAADTISLHDHRSDFETLQRDGYVVIRGALPRPLVDAVNADLDEFKRRNRRLVAANLDQAGRLHRIVNLHLVIDSLASVFSANAALDVCDTFFDAETVLYSSLLFERGTEQGLHRDSPLFVTRPEGNYLGVWAALEDVDADNGPLVVVPKSHTLPSIDVEAMGRALYGDPSLAPSTHELGWVTYQDAVKKLAEAHGLTPIEVHVRAGDVIVWHPLLFHGGAIHRVAARNRRSFVMHVTPKGMPVYHQDVFFNPQKPVSDSAPWTYYEHGGRQLGRFYDVDFGHKFLHRDDVLVSPGASGPQHLKILARRLKRRLR